MPVGRAPRTDMSAPQDAARVRKICDAIALGATPALACKYAGISNSMYNNWRNAYPDFVEQLREAEGRGMMGWLLKIEAAANAGAWQAAAWKLERRYPETYGRQVQDQRRLQMNITPADLEKMTDADIEAALARTLIKAGDEDV